MVPLDFAHFAHTRVNKDLSSSTPTAACLLKPVGTGAQPHHPPTPEVEAVQNSWKLALESSGDGVWDWNVATGEQTFSRHWKEMLGYSDAEIGNGYHEFIRRVHPEDLSRLLTSDREYLEGRATNNAVELRMLCKDGSWKWVLSRFISVSRDAQGKPLHITGTQTDISERKQTEAQLHEINRQLHEKTQLLETTLLSITQGIFVFDSETRVIVFNPRVCELLDLSPAFLATQPTLEQINALQQARGDFGHNACLIDSQARDYLRSGGNTALPNHYLRTTLDGRTLEIKTQVLPNGGKVRTFADVSNYMQAEAARQRLDLLLEATQSIARVGGIEHDYLNDVMCWTAGVYRLLEIDPQDYTPSMATIRRFLTLQALTVIKAYLASSNQALKWHDLELELLTAKGQRIWVHAVGTSTSDKGRIIKQTTVVQDITERKRNEAVLRDSEERWKLALESTGDGLWDWHIPSGEEFFSQRLKEMYGYDNDELADRIEELDGRTHPDDQEQVKKDRQAHFDGHTPSYTNEHRIRCKNGQWKWVLSRGMVISRDAQNQPLRMIGTHTDITERKKSEALIWQQAHFDALTGLPNRRMLRERLGQEIRKSQQDGHHFAIVFIDLDHFKEVNDTLGHDAGDQLLLEVARRIQACLHEQDTVARMGGDEFTVILNQLSSVKKIERLLQKLLHALESVFHLGSEQVFISASMGVTIYPVDGVEIETLFKNADQALYVAKDAGRNRFSFFSPALKHAAQDRVRLLSDLHTALEEQQFRVVYQPIVDLSTGAIHKAEALIRWQHPTRGLVNPVEFIAIAEASGLIADIGDWVFQQVARQVKVWRTTLSPSLQISVNKSPVQFQHSDNIYEHWIMQLHALGLPGDSIVVEITEGLLLASSANINQQLKELHAAGVQVSLDDFGTGYSSLSYLQKFDIDFIKIDQSFVRNLVPGSTEWALCKAIIVMSHELGIKVIAEGIETIEQRQLLTAAGCDYGQGYLFAQPLSALAFETLLKAQ